MTTRLVALFCLVALPLSGCANDAPDASAPATPTEPTAAASAEPAASVPSGSAGSFTLRYLAGDGEAAQATEVSGTLPPALPSTMAAVTSLTDVPDFRVGIDEATLPSGADLDGAVFLFVLHRDDEVTVRDGTTWTERGGTDVYVTDARAGRRNNFPDTFTGRATAFAFAPLWTAGDASPTLLLDTVDGDQRVATMPLAVIPGDRSVWFQSVDGPSTGGEDLRLEADFVLSDPRLVPLLIYKRARGGYQAADLELDTTEVRRRERAGETTAGRPMRASLRRMDTEQPEAYLFVVAL